MITHFYRTIIIFVVEKWVDLLSHSCLECPYCGPPPWLATTPLHVAGAGLHLF